MCPQGSHALGEGNQRHWLSFARQGDIPQPLSGSVLRQGLDKLSRLAFQFMIPLPWPSESWDYTCGYYSGLEFMFHNGAAAGLHCQHFLVLVLRQG